MSDTKNTINHPHLGVLAGLLWPLAAGLSLVEIYKLNAPYEAAEQDMPEDLRRILSFVLGYFAARGVVFSPPAIPVMPSVALDLSHDLDLERLNAAALAEAYKAMTEADRVLHSTSPPPTASILDGAIGSLFRRAAAVGGGIVAHTEAALPDRAVWLGPLL